jgi:anti-sigma factor RsiW
MTTFTGHLTDAQAQRHLDGVLAPAEANEVETHLDGCAACQRLVESYLALSAALDDLAVPELPADFTANVIERIEVRERTVARERGFAFGILAAVVCGALVAFVAAGAGSWAPAVSSWADGLGETARALRISSGFLPTVVGALRLQMLLAVAVVAIPLLIAIARLIPSPRPEVA